MSATPKRTPRTSPRLQAKREAERYEFSAPQYYDFGEPSSPGSGPADSWFERRHSSEANRPTAGATPTAARGSPQVPLTVTQNRKRYSDERSLRGPADRRQSAASNGAPRKSPHPAQSPMVVANGKSSSSNMFNSEPSPTAKRQTSYERLFQMTTKQERAPRERPAVESHEPQLGKVRTPDKVKLARLKTAGPLLPTRSTKPLTVPVEFNFSERTRPEKRVSFDLSKNAIKPIPAIKPKPAALATKKDPIAAVKTAERQLTQPKSPMLMTKLRQKPLPKVLTAEERAVEEMKRVKPFTARPVDVKALGGAGNVGIPHVKKSKITVPVDVQLATASRSHHPAAPVQQKQAAKSTSPFKATPIPVEVLQQPSRLPPKKQHKLTVPQSPNIHKPAPRPAATLPDFKQPTPFKARPAPHAKPFVPTIEHTYLEPLPVHLPGEAIAEEKRRRFQEALNREREAAEEARTFHARPAPDFDKEDNGVPPPTHRLLTKPEPFQLQSDLRTAAHQAELAKRLEEEETRLQEGREFRSKPAPHVAPFMPHKSTRPLTQAGTVHLHSTARAERRREFDEALRRKEAQLGELERKQHALQRQREEEELRELQRQLVPKAQPVMRAPPMEVRPSARPLTVPQSPALSTARRLRKRSDNE